MATLFGVSITQRRQTEQQRLDREQRERADRQADARRLRDAKLERLRTLYTTVVRSAQTNHGHFLGILAYEAADKVKEKTGQTITVPDGGKADDPEWGQANAAWAAYRASLTVEADTQPVREALDALGTVMFTYIAAIDDNEDRDPIKTNKDASQALARLETAIRDSLAEVEAAADN